MRRQYEVDIVGFWIVWDISGDLPVTLAIYPTREQADKYRESCPIPREFLEVKQIGRWVK